MVINKHCDIEIALDLGEDENKKDTNKELEEKNTFFQSYITQVITKKCRQTIENNHILHQYRSHIIDVQSPPPKHTV